MLDLDRRRFTFGSLLALVAPSAAAAIPELQAPQPPPQLVPQAGPAPVGLRPVVAVERAPGRLYVDLALINEGSAPIDVLIALGARPGAAMNVVVVDGAGQFVALERDIDRRELVSRMGPMPQWAPIAAHHRAELGRYAFLLAGSAPVAVRIDVRVETGSGSVELPTVRVGASEVAS
ncbi:MAG: hypothetical protein ABMB14_24860 [Myxococcota bacterium]